MGTAPIWGRDGRRMEARFWDSTGGEGFHEALFKSDVSRS